MVFSSVGSLSEISLLPFHHLKINKLITSHNFLSIKLCQQQSLHLQTTTTTTKKKKKNGFFIFCSSSSTDDDFTTSTTNDDTCSMEEEESSMTTMATTTTTEEEEEEPEATTNPAPAPAPVKRTRIRYRKAYPGEDKGIIEEMRFVSMRLHNKKTKKRIRIQRKELSNGKDETLEEEVDEDEEDPSSDKDSDSDYDDGETLETKEEDPSSESSDKDNDSDDGDDEETLETKEEGESLESSDKDGGETLETKEEGESLESSDKDGGDAQTWRPSIEGFLKYLVDSKLVFETLERIVNESDNISYTNFRNTGLERSPGLAKDLEWFRQQNNVIPTPSKHGINYARYLEELSQKRASMFLCHYYNIYFAHISGGQVIAKQVSEKVLEGRELEFNTWEGDAFELLKNVRDNLNELGEDWTRDQKNKCLKETSKSFRYLGNIVRLIIL